MTKIRIIMLKKLGVNINKSTAVGTSDWLSDWQKDKTDMFTLEGVNFSMRLLVLKLRLISLFLSPAILDLNIWIVNFPLILIWGGGQD